jgi:hypothetical protein
MGFVISCGNVKSKEGTGLWRCSGSDILGKRKGSTTGGKFVASYAKNTFFHG